MRALLGGDSRRAGYVSLAELEDDTWSDGAAPSLPSCPSRQASISSEAEKNCDARLQRYRRVLSLGYFLAMGVSGIVLRHLATKEAPVHQATSGTIGPGPGGFSAVSVIITYLYDLMNSGLARWRMTVLMETVAERGKREWSPIGPVFITRSFGCALGALASTYLYGRMRKNTVIYVSMQALMAVLVYLPFTASKWSLHAALLAAGLFTAIVDTGCQIMTQRLYGATAGSYLGANLLAYSVSGACVPVLAYITDSLVKQYAILAAMTGVIGVIIFLPPAPETVPGMMEDIPDLVGTLTHRENRAEMSTLRSRWRTFCEKYEIEFCIGTMVFWVVGGKDAATLLLKNYAIDTRLHNAIKERLIVEWMWLAFVIGRLAGLVDLQYVVNLPRLHRQLMVLFLIGALGAGAVVAFEGSEIVLWAGVAAYGLSNGPLCGYCNDLYNRIARHSDTGVSMVVFGMNAGSMIPYLTTWLCTHTHWPQSLFLFLAASHSIPLWLLLSSRRLADSKTKKKTVSECSTSTSTSLSDATDEEISLLGTAR